MTDNPGASAGPPRPAPRGPTVSDNIRAQMWQRRLTIDNMLDGIAARLPQREAIERSAWRDRMRRPGLWRLRELEAVAQTLGVSIHDLIDPDPDPDPER